MGQYMCVCVCMCVFVWPVPDCVCDNITCHAAVILCSHMMTDRLCTGAQAKNTNT